MSNINKQALREAADSVIQKYGSEWFEAGSQVCTVHKSKIILISTANPATVLALLDELESAEKRIAELEAREVKLPRSFNREMFGEGMYEVPNGNWMHRKDVTEALLAAGIITKVGE